MWQFWRFVRRNWVEASRVISWPLLMTKTDPFKYFHSSPAIICLTVMLYVRFPLSLWNVEDLLHERGIDVCHEIVRFWWNGFGPMFASETRRDRASRMRAHLDKVFVKISGEPHYLWRAVDHEGDVLDSYVTKHWNRKAVFKLLKKSTT
jgi:putative transposase